MPKAKRKGLVEFHQPAAKLVADIPEDEAVREQLQNQVQDDGYPGSCTVLNPK
ncbi:hypothetical protein ACFQ88_01950 [Paenibacillus sp. NPDC056579]|uniref:hypothetical protein n=1 Tax=unclassified Paenibacillus TaxID=185978 RepID=UPI001EF7A663|nr:hypothetical protein [Paenibacillus sp. H1-7]